MAANRLEAIKDYLGSVANRTLGRHAWIEAGRESARDYAQSQKPEWAKKLSMASFHQSIPLYLELVAPASSRHLTAIFADIETSKPRGKYTDYIEVGRFLTAVATDVAVIVFDFEVGRHYVGEVLGLKLASNAATHVGLDIIGAAAKRVRNFRSSGTTLAI